MVELGTRTDIKILQCKSSSPSLNTGCFSHLSLVLQSGSQTLVSACSLTLVLQSGSELQWSPEGNYVYHWHICSEDLGREAWTTHYYFYWPQLSLFYLKTHLVNHNFSSWVIWPIQQYLQLFCYQNKAHHSLNPQCRNHDIYVVLFQEEVIMLFCRKISSAQVDTFSFPFPFKVK